MLSAGTARFSGMLPYAIPVRAFPTMDNIDSIGFGPDEIFASSFAGGGGACCGISAAIGRSVDLAINHSPAAIAMHAANHPLTRHRIEDVFAVDPVEACEGRGVALKWASPDCTHFSRAKGGQPKSAKTRALAWVVTRWARDVAPRVIVVENVPEFVTWGPLDEHGEPIEERTGDTFAAWVRRLRRYGYRVDWRVLSACDYGAPTTRKRLFVIARRDGRPIVWPDPTHGPGRAKPFRAAAECIDWSIPCPSIVGRKRPLAAATIKRIVAGLKKFVFPAGRPFIVPLTHQGNDQRSYSVDEPIRTIAGANRGEMALVMPRFSTAFIEKAFGGPNGNSTPGSSILRPLDTVTATDHNRLVVVALSSESDAQPHPALASMLREHFDGREAEGLLDVDGRPCRIVDIGLRMLTPAELFAAQGFPPDYRLDVQLGGRRLTKTELIRLCGNAVCPPVAEAIVAANLGRVSSAPRASSSPESAS